MRGLLGKPLIHARLRLENGDVWRNVGPVSAVMDMGSVVETGNKQTSQQTNKETNIQTKKQQTKNTQTHIHTHTSHKEFFVLLN
jgi:hypothetical protein